MARMVATKAALSIRVDALTDADGKSEPAAPSIGLENRAKLEARLRSLEGGIDAAAVRGAQTGKKQQRFQMNGETSTYNTAADAVDLLPSQREPMESAVQAVLDVKAEKKKAKEERRAKRKAEKEAEESDDENKMDVDGETPKKRKRAEAAKEEKKSKVCICYSNHESLLTYDVQHEGETEEERKARKKAKKAAKEAAAEGESKKKRRKSEA